MRICLVRMTSLVRRQWRGVGPEGLTQSDEAKQQPQEEQGEQQQSQQPLPPGAAGLVTATASYFSSSSIVLPLFMDLCGTPFAIRFWAHSPQRQCYKNFENKHQTEETPTLLYVESFPNNDSLKQYYVQYVMIYSQYA